jgi:hypothetical protein
MLKRHTAKEILTRCIPVCSIGNRGNGGLPTGLTCRRSENRLQGKTSHGLLVLRELRRMNPSG